MQWPWEKINYGKKYRLVEIETIWRHKTLVNKADISHVASKAKGMFIAHAYLFYQNKRAEGNIWIT